MFGAEDFAELEELMRDTFTLEIVTPGASDPLTGAGEEATVQEVIRQPCSDQDESLRGQSRYIINGVNGSIPVSRCYTRHFPWPDTGPGESLIIRVNGRQRDSLRQGPPTDIGGMGEWWMLELSAPVGGEA